jgi:hypothetical protein
MTDGGVCVEPELELEAEGVKLLDRELRCERRGCELRGELKPDSRAEGLKAPLAGGGSGCVEPPRGCVVESSSIEANRPGSGGGLVDCGGVIGSATSASPGEG